LPTSKCPLFAEKTDSVTPTVEPFRYTSTGKRTVHLDGCVKVEAAYYSAPHVTATELAPSRSLIRQLTLYRDFIQDKTKKWET
jgi:hypothetical protein